MSILANNLKTDQVCGNCGAWESDPFGKGWIGSCPFDQVLYAFSKKCENDRWIPKYDCEAIKWCLKYAEQGNAQAQYCLGMVYENEKSDVPNVELAYMWFSLASLRGHADAVKQIKELEKKMTLSEIVRAKNLAKEKTTME